MSMRCWISAVLGLMLTACSLVPADPGAPLGELELADYGSFTAGSFQFHDTVAAERFFAARGGALCYRQDDDGAPIWQARLAPAAERLPSVVLAYIAEQEARYPDDPTWGLEPCPEAVDLPLTQLADYGDLQDQERFFFHDPAAATRFWATASTAGWLCRDADGLRTVVAVTAPLDLAVAALDYWAEAGVVALAGGECAND